MKIKSIKKENFSGKVYNFSTPPFHNYFANGVLVHNCHEMSTTKGKHGDPAWIEHVYSDVIVGTEVAIGGGNPFSHPQFERILKFFKDRGVVANVTINSAHLERFQDQYNSFVEKGLITALGVSYNFKNHNDLQLIKDRKNVVIHTIIGVNTVNEVWNLTKEGWKVLLLGYKDWGFGKIFAERNDIESKKQEWFNDIKLFFGKANLSFDNLAVAQLQMKRFFGDEEWKRAYQGDDGSISMYVDAVNQKFAKNSTSNPMIAYRKTLKEMFVEIK